MVRTTLISFLFICPLFTLAQTDRFSAKSVVKIKTSYIGQDREGNSAKVINTSSGWTWNDPLWVVTTLHSVAGVENIEVCSTTKNCANAKIVRVLKEADLALLRIEKDLGLQPLTTQAISPQSSETYYIWGYPHDVYTIQGDEIKFSRSLNQFPTLSDIITGNKLKQQLVNQGYPLPSAKIYRISSIIQPGHSGAPILTSGGKVIGIADGGLRGGTARINWAMPSETYLRSLISSTEVIPTAVSIQHNLYSNAYYVPIDASDSDVDQYIAQDEALSTVSSGTGTEVHKTWTASLDEIYWTLDEEDQETIDELISDGLENYISNTFFDIYEDYNTGASFAVPFGSTVVYQDELFHIELEHSYLAFAPINAFSFEEAALTLGVFVEEVLAQYPGSNISLNFEDEYEANEYDEYVNSVVFREVFFEGENYLLIVGGEVMGSDLACLLLVCPLPREMDENQIEEFLKLALSTEIISFSGH